MTRIAINLNTQKGIVIWPPVADQEYGNLKELGFAASLFGYSHQFYKNARE